MKFEELAAMITVRNHALILANHHKRRNKIEEEALRSMIDKIDDFIVKFAVDDFTKVKYGLKMITKTLEKKTTTNKKVKKEKTPTEEPKKGVVKRVDQDVQETVTT